MKQFIIFNNQYLRQNIIAFCHTDYLGYNKVGNPDYINTIKNTFNNIERTILNKAIQELGSVLFMDLPKIQQIVGINSITVCVVPRAKNQTHYQPNQLLFKSTIQDFINQQNTFRNGTDYIVRHTNTKTTHFKNQPANYNNDGPKPYPGITNDTCNISNEVSGKNILLIDDIYTRTVNIDEDVIQTLLNNGAKSVIFYAIGQTVMNRF